MNIAKGTRLRLIQSTDATPPAIPNGTGTVNNPDTIDYSTFPESPFDVNGDFVVPKSGFYGFNAATQLQSGGLVLVSVQVVDGKQVDGAGAGTNRAALTTTLYLEKGQYVRRLVSLYDGTDTAILPSSNSNFYEIEFLGNE